MLKLKNTLSVVWAVLQVFNITENSACFHRRFIFYLFIFSFWPLANVFFFSFFILVNDKSSTNSCNTYRRFCTRHSIGLVSGLSGRIYHIVNASRLPLGIPGGNRTRQIVSRRIRPPNGIYVLRA